MKTYWQNYIDGAWVDGGAVMAPQQVHLSGARADLRPAERGRWAGENNA